MSKKLTQNLKKLQYKKFLVYGLGKSGIASVNFLLKQNMYFEVYDDDNKKLVDFLLSYPYLKTLNYVSEFEITKFDYIIVSPGIAQNNEILQLAKLNDVCVITEVELYYLFYNPFLIGITGTNGKTTTALLTNHILSSCFQTEVCGNIGTPLCSLNYDKNKIFVAELSSFQLSYLNKLKCNISVILNLNPNHLDWHFNFEDYKKAKLNIFKNSGKDDILILNADEPNLQDINFNEIKCKTYFVSTKREVFGAFLKNDKIYVKINNKEQEIADVSNVNLIGEHNFFNVLVGVLIAKILNVKNESIENALKTFKTPEHRLEKFFDFENVECFNDSKSTTPNSTICALRALKQKNVILLLGGSGKNLSYQELVKEIKPNVIKVLLFGEQSNIIAEQFKNQNKNFEVCFNINEAIEKAVDFAIKYTKCYFLQNADFTPENISKNILNRNISACILFSPACASFDSFANFEERGIYFKEYLKSYVEDTVTNNYLKHSENDVNITKYNGFKGVNDT